MRGLPERLGNWNLNRWRAWFSVYPFTQEREDLRMSMLAAVIHNVSGNMKKAADLETYSFKWNNDQKDERTAFGALKAWAKTTEGV